MTTKLPPAPRPPTVNYAKVNPNNSVTLTGTATAGSTVTVTDAYGNVLGTTAANLEFVWQFTTAPQSPGTYVFAATETDPGHASSQPVFSPSVVVR